MPDTFAASHLTTTSSQYGSAANSSAMSKTQKYANLAQTHIFTPIAIEKTGATNHQASEPITEIGRRITEITGEVRIPSTSSNKCPWQYSAETCSASQGLSSPRTHNFLIYIWVTSITKLHSPTSIFSLQASCLRAQKNNKKNKIK